MFSLLIEPPKPIRQRLYMCDKRFHLDNILEMYKSTVSYGFVLVSGKEYLFYIVDVVGKSKHIKLINHNDLVKQKTHKKGGQSAVRFQRQEAIKKANNIKHVTDSILDVYTNNNKSIINKLIIAGCGPIKNEIAKDDLLNKYFKIDIVATKDIADNTIYSIVNNYNLETGSEIKTNNIVGELDNILKTNSDLLVIGYDEVIDGLHNKLLAKVIINSNADVSKIKDLLYDKCELVSIDNIGSEHWLFKQKEIIIGVRYY